MRESRRFAFGCVAALAALLVANVAGATPITRAQFGPGSVNFDFGPANAGTLTNGNLTVVGTLVPLTSDTFAGSSVIENPNSAGIRLNFASPVSAVGMDFFANNTPTTLSVFDSANVLLESVTISNIGLPIGSQFAFPFGFIGLNENANVIAFAIINGGLGANTVDERIDNVVYGQAVPEPATLTLTALGLAGFARRYRRRSTNA